jgi:Glyoxalase-like domain
MELTVNIDAERNRLIGLGATQLSDEIVEDCWRRYVMAHPGDNEFCVLQPPGTRGGEASA